MHFHMPKPFHGWREFVGEVGIIVVGVLIALGAEQVVERWHWNHKAAEAEEAIAKELASNAGVLEERTLQAPCLTQSLRQLGPILLDARKTGRIGDIGGIDGPYTRPVVTATWDAAVAEGTTSHIPEDRRQSYQIVYSVISGLNRQSEDEHLFWSDIASLVHAPGKLPEPMLAQISSSHRKAVYLGWLVSISAEQQLALIERLGIKPNYFLIYDDLKHTRADVLKDMTGDGNALPNCAPVTVDGKPVPLPKVPPAS